VSELGPGPEGEPLAPAWRRREMALALAALGALLLVIIGLRSHIETFVHVERPAAIDTTRSMRERRAHTLSALGRAHLVAEVDSAGESPQVYLTATFFALTTDQQLACMDSLYEAFYPGVRKGPSMLLVYDAHNRRLIGAYSPPHGLILEE